MENKQERIAFLKKKIQEYETLRTTCKNPQQVDDILRAYKQELKELGVATLDVWF